MSDKHPIDTFTDAMANDCFSSINKLIELVGIDEFDEKQRTKEIIYDTIRLMVTKKIRKKMGLL